MVDSFECVMMHGLANPKCLIECTVSSSRRVQSKTKIDIKRTGNSVDWFELVQYRYQSLVVVDALMNLGVP